MTAPLDDMAGSVGTGGGRALGARGEDVCFYGGGGQFYRVWRVESARLDGDGGGV